MLCDRDATRQETAHDMDRQTMLLTHCASCETNQKHLLAPTTILTFPVHLGFAIRSMGTPLTPSMAQRKPATSMRQPPG